LTKLFKDIGKNVAKLHDYHIVHGDLTTSNIFLKFDDETIQNKSVFEFN
jgi:tRNA A-37 threonylcarbamoyl transferase component Bud32